MPLSASDFAPSLWFVLEASVPTPEKRCQSDSCSNLIVRISAGVSASDFWAGGGSACVHPDRTEREMIKPSQPRTRRVAMTHPFGRRVRSLLAKFYFTRFQDF